MYSSRGTDTSIETELSGTDTLDKTSNTLE